MFGSVPRFKSYEDAQSALEAAIWMYEETEREYHEYVGVMGDFKDPHAKFLRHQVKLAYKFRERVLSGVRQSGFSQLATNYLIGSY
jgi:hypothetical protein